MIPPAAGLFEEVIESEEAMAVAGECATPEAAEASEVALEEQEVQIWSEKALASAKTFKDYVVKGMQGLTIEKVVMLGTGVIMLYEFIEKQASQAKSSGKRISLDSAIKGVQRALVDNYDKTIVTVAKKSQSNPNYPTWTKLVRDTIDSEATMTGDVYWLTIGPEIMAKLAEMPIYSTV